MNREDILRMAREADVWAADIPLYHPQLERFAALVAAHEREKVARFIMAQCFSTGRNDSIEGMLDALVRQVAEREREACAKIADAALGDNKVSDAIRARGEKP